jgi:hypothetical protein
MADGAHRLDTTGRSIDDLVEEVVGLVRGGDGRTRD